MPSFPNIRYTPRLFFGLAIIILGTLLLLDNLEIMEAENVLRYWPLFLIFIGLPRALQPAGSTGRLFGIALVIFGSLLFLDRLEIFDVRFWDFWPILLILLGVSMLRRHTKNVVSVSVISSADQPISADDSTINAGAYLGGHDFQNSSKDFRGGAATVFMGGCKIDLRSASIKKESAVIDVFAFWGGIEILVPDTWKVTVQGYPILGGIDDKTIPPKRASEKQLIIKGYAIMGGVEIKN